MRQAVKSRNGPHHARPARRAGRMAAACFLLALLVALLGLVWPQEGAALGNAAPPITDLVAARAAQTEPAATHPPTDQACRSCHGDSQAVIVFPSGEELPVRVDLPAFDASVHGTAAIDAGAPVGCNGCHPPATYQFPHPPVAEPDLRAYELSRSETCVGCHDPHLTAHPGPEWSGGFDQELSETGMAVVCTDCHGEHEVQPIAVWQQPASATVCADCHASAGIEPADPAVLFQHIEAGLFRQKQVSTDFCMGCHGPPDRFMTLPNGDTLSISIDGDALHASVHGADNPWQPLDCTDCHENYNYPHPPVEAQSAREYTIERQALCARCHETQTEGHLDSVHAEAMAEGNLDAATCVDCHTAHETPVPDEPRSRLSLVCQQCHSTIFEEYATSVHGEPLLNEENPDVPTCIDCHGVHDINDPTTALARNRSPELCASCHANEAMMDHYDISTDVFETYVDDFHGTTVTIFQSNDPNTPTNKAVCYDCHGVHHITDPHDDEEGIKQNLLVTCQQCHPDATANFSTSWTGHHRPSLRDNPLMFLINLFYAIVIPSTVVFLTFLVGTDIYRKVNRR